MTEQLWKSRERAFLPTLDLMARVAGPHCSFTELRQMLPVNAIDLGLHLGMPALSFGDHQDGRH